MKSARNFKSAQAYRKWVAAGHIHHYFENSPGNTPVKIKGKVHKVNHNNKK